MTNPRLDNKRRVMARTVLCKIGPSLIPPSFFRVMKRKTKGFWVKVELQNVGRNFIHRSTLYGIHTDADHFCTRTKFNVTGISLLTFFLALQTKMTPVVSDLNNV